MCRSMHRSTIAADPLFYFRPRTIEIDSVRVAKATYNVYKYHNVYTLCLRSIQTHN